MIEDCQNKGNMLGMKLMKRKKVLRKIKFSYNLKLFFRISKKQT